MSERIEPPVEGAHVAPEPAAPDQADDEWYDEPQEPYTRKRFLRELSIAVAILAVGLPAVLLLAPDGQQATEETALVQTAPSLTPSPTPAVSTTLDTRPVVLVSADLEQPAAQQLATAVVQVAGSTASAASQPGKGWTSGQPSLATLVAGSVPSPEVAMVVVQAGAADVEAAPGDVVQGAALVADRLRTAVSGSTSITLVGPVPQGEPTAGLLRVRDELRQAARQKSVHFVDPVELGLQEGQPDLSSALGAAIGRFIRPAGS